MKKGDFSDSEIKNAKNSIIRSLNSIDCSLGSINGYLLSLIISEDSINLDETIKLIQSVTKEDIVEFANSVTPELEYILGGAE